MTGRKVLCVCFPTRRRVYTARPGLLDSWSREIESQRDLCACCFFFLFLLWVGGWVWFLSGGFEDEVGVVGVWYNSIDGAGSSAKVGCMIYTPGIESGVDFPSVIVLLVFGFSS